MSGTERSCGIERFRDSQVLEVLEIPLDYAGENLPKRVYRYFKHFTSCFQDFHSLPDKLIDEFVSSRAGGGP